MKVSCQYDVAAAIRAGCDVRVYAPGEPVIVEIDPCSLSAVDRALLSDAVGDVGMHKKFSGIRGVPYLSVAVTVIEPSKDGFLEALRAESEGREPRKTMTPRGMANTRQMARRAPTGMGFNRKGSLVRRRGN